jgi:hypothetical protein
LKFGGTLAINFEMSLYNKSCLYAILTGVVILSSPFWVAYIGQEFGVVGYISCGVVAIAHFAVYSLCFECPNCGLCAFESRKGLVVTRSIIPNQKCGHCGHDHTMPDADLRK